MQANGRQSPHRTVRRAPAAAHRSSRGLPISAPPRPARPSPAHPGRRSPRCPPSGFPPSWAPLLHWGCSSSRSPLRAAPTGRDGASPLTVIGVLGRPRSRRHLRDRAPRAAREGTSRRMNSKTNRRNSRVRLRRYSPSANLASRPWVSGVPSQSLWWRGFPRGGASTRPKHLARRSRAAGRAIPVPRRDRRRSACIRGGPDRPPTDPEPWLGRRHPPEAGPAWLLGPPQDALPTEVCGDELATPPPRRTWPDRPPPRNPPWSQPHARGLRRVRRPVRPARWRASLLFRRQHRTDDDPLRRGGRPAGDELARLARRPTARRRRLGLLRSSERDARLLGGARCVRRHRVASVDPQVEACGGSRGRVLPRAETAPRRPSSIRGLGEAAPSGPLLLRHLGRPRDARAPRLWGRCAHEAGPGSPETEDATRRQMERGRGPPGSGARFELLPGSRYASVRPRAGACPEQMDHVAGSQGPRRRLANPSGEAPAQIMSGDSTEKLLHPEVSLESRGGLNPLGKV